MKSNRAALGAVLAVLATGCGPIDLRNEHEDDGGSGPPDSTGQWTARPGGSVEVPSAEWTEIALPFSEPARLVRGSSADTVWVASDHYSAWWDGATWTVADFSDASITDVWGTSATNLYVTIGGSATVEHFDGGPWEQETFGWNNDDAYCVRGSSADDVWVGLDWAYAPGGIGVNLAHWDGVGWEVVGNGEIGSFEEIAPVGPGEFWSLFYLGSGTIGMQVGHWTPDSWGMLPMHEASAIAGSPAGDAWIVGSGGLLAQAHGSQVDTLVSPTTEDLHAVWAGGPNDVWIGGGGALLHFDGAAWVDVTEEPGAPPGADSILGFTSDDVWVVSDGKLYHYAI